MAFSVLGARVNKHLLPFRPSSGSTNFPVRGDLVFLTTETGLYEACSSVAPSTIARKIIGILDIVSTASSNPSYIIPVNGELLEADMTTKLATALTSTGTTSLTGYMYRFEFSTAFGTLVDVSTAGTDDNYESSTEITGGGSTVSNTFIMTAFSTASRKVKGFIPSGYCL
jgi:hypothetical protein